ncbi:3'-5' exonuclease [Cellulophaga sp. HaHaR_3_176]|uniref:3'-5' exonuclease n=1 Tax=Cellulophaga sp. HaHaR_3_176 TaxID=1942464 RepID=UPI001C1F7FFE|nr:3'-5' exonuclease [Cellulophaga sp. HaHaR_3_176]QWX84869.1 3'-5' exonuclease [Cellulophaga sp. HaHaR_3_176]
MLEFFKKKSIDNPEYWKAYEATFTKELPKNINDITFIVLDTETTGFNYATDRMLCIGAVKLINNSISLKDGFEVYIEQEVYGKESAKIHGILKNEVIPRLSELEALKQFLSYIENAVIIAHHTFFDLTMINTALLRHGLPRLKNINLDTSDLYKKTLIKTNLLTKKENYSLDDLADKFNISKKDRHTAMGDAYITAILFLKIVSKLKDKKEVTLKYLLR